MPKVVVKETSPVWIKSGNKDALDLAKERMEEILATHKLEPLTPAQEQIIENVLKEPREYYRKMVLFSDEEWTVYLESSGVS